MNEFSGGDLLDQLLKGARFFCVFWVLTGAQEYGADREGIWVGEDYYPLGGADGRHQIGQAAHPGRVKSSVRPHPCRGIDDAVAALPVRRQLPSSG